MTPRWRRVALLSCRIGVSLVLLIAGLQKVGAPADFARAVGGYQLLPLFGVAVVGLVLPWLEIVVAICLLVDLLPACAALLAVVLAVAFEIGIVSAILRGLDIRCGCFHDESNVSWVHAGLDLVLLVAALALFVSAVRFAGPGAVPTCERESAP